MAPRRFDFNDMLIQIGRLRRMGPLDRILDMVPGLRSSLVQGGSHNLEGDLCRIEAIIRSMTPAERRNPDLLDPSRLMRVARGSGASLRQASDLVDRLFEIRRAM